jgi:hypothetical protein
MQLGIEDHVAAGDRILADAVSYEVESTSLSGDASSARMILGMD